MSTFHVSEFALFSLAKKCVLIQNKTFARKKTGMQQLCEL